MHGRRTSPFERKTDADRDVSSPSLRERSWDGAGSRRECGGYPNPPGRASGILARAPGPGSSHSDGIGGPGGLALEKLLQGVESALERGHVGGEREPGVALGAEG